MGDFPRWARVLLRFVARPSDADDIVGDYEESHCRRRGRRRPLAAWTLSSVEAVDLVASIAWSRLRRLGPGRRDAGRVRLAASLSRFPWSSTEALRAEG